MLDLAWQPIKPPKPSLWYASAAGQTGVTIAAALALAAGITGAATAQEGNVLFRPTPTYPIKSAQDTGQHFPPAWPNPVPTYPIKSTLEKLTGTPDRNILPVPGRPPADLGKLALAKPDQLTKMVIDDEPGGRLDTHEMRFKKWAALGVAVEIRGMCQSACTLVMSNVPRERICFSATGYLNFHWASVADGKIASREYTQWMIESYPADIRAWIEAKGGINKMPVWWMWKLTAPELWKMGYRKCPD